MSWVTRAPDIARDLGREMARLVPRTLAGLNESTGWVPASPRGVRTFMSSEASAPSGVIR